MTRSCGTCSACCRWPSVEEINKPPRTRCQHLEKRGHGCKIYSDRPTACSEYSCSWLRGRGGEEDQPDRCGVLIDRRHTQFGHLLVAKQLRPDSAMTERGREAIRRATRDEGLPCLVVDYEDADRVVGVAGPPEFREEVARREIDGVIRVGGRKDWMQNIVEAATQGRVYPGLDHGG